MKKIAFILLFLAGHAASNAQVDTVAKSYFVTYGKGAYLKKLADLSIGIAETDQLPVILKKLRTFLTAYQPNSRLSDDYYAQQSALQALKSVEQGGYGIGAILVDSNGVTLAAASNRQIQQQRSDLHAEMTLLTSFEKKTSAKKYLNSFTYKPGLTVISSAEPCPMCFMRLAIVGVKTLYCTPGPDDGMASHVNCLPQSWIGLASKNPIKRANSSPIMQKISHLLFYSFLMDARGPKNN